jgi:CRP-like cAMP-binding protein
MGARTFIALFREGQIICEQGDPGNEVFYVEKGHVELRVRSKRGKETVLAILHRGNYFGSGCMTGQALRTVTATALTGCTVLVSSQTISSPAYSDGTTGLKRT